MRKELLIIPDTNYKMKNKQRKKDNQLNWRQNGTGTITIAVKSMRGEEDLMGTCLVVEDKQRISKIKIAHQNQE